MASLCLDKCCICIPLRAGCIIIGYVLAICKMIAMFVTTTHVVMIKTMISAHLKVVPSAHTRLLLLYGIAFMYALKSVMGISLLIGLHKNKLEDVRKFNLVYPIFLVFFVLLYVIALATCGKDYTTFEWYMQSCEGLFVLFDLYSVFVVRRCYIQLKAKLVENRGTVYNTTNA